MTSANLVPSEQMVSSVANFDNSDHPRSGQENSAGDNNLKGANPKNEQSADVLTAGLEKDLAHIGEVVTTPECCTLGASPKDGVKTSPSTEDPHRSGRCPSKVAKTTTMLSSDVQDTCPKAMVKEYQVNNTSGVLESLVKEVYDAEGRMIWYKIIKGGRNRPGLTSQETTSASCPLCEKCRQLVQSSHEGDPIRKVGSIHSPPVAAKLKASSKKEFQQIEGTEEGRKTAEPEKKSRKAKSGVCFEADGGSASETSAIKSVTTDKEGGITRTVLQFLGELEDATIKSNRMREKNVLSSHHDVIKLFLLSQGFLIAVFMFLAIVFVNVAALSLMIVVFATR